MTIYGSQTKKVHEDNHGISIHYSYHLHSHQPILIGHKCLRDQTPKFRDCPRALNNGHFVLPKPYVDNDSDRVNQGKV